MVKWRIFCIFVAENQKVMFKIQPLDQVCSIVSDALERTKKVRKDYKKFFVETFILILTIYGKINFLQMARHGQSCESRFRQNFKKEFDWCAYNVNMKLEVQGYKTAIALDHSYLPKSGKMTPGIAYYWSGCAGTTKRGLEILGFAHIAEDTCDARFLFAEQTLSISSKGRTPYYLEHMKDKRDNQTARCLRTIYSKKEHLLGLSNLLVGDCLFASFNFVTGAQRLGFNVISRLRDDAVLQYLYTGPQKEGRGRKKELDGQVDITNLKEDVFSKETVQIGDDSLIVYSAIVKSKSLKTNIKVVIAEFECKTKTVRKILFSTDTELSAAEILRLYHARFQIEFLFRDAKQNTGLEDWQSTDTDRLSFGYNASLTAVNVAREMSNKIYKQTGRKLSVASVKKVLHNEALCQHIKKLFTYPEFGHPQNNYWLSDEIPPNILFFGVRDSS